MKISRSSRVTLCCVALVATLGVLPAGSATAASTTSIQKTVTSLSKLVADSNPRLLCKATGEISGSHPGWNSVKSIKLTLVDLGNSTFGLYWCPAAAPNGQGVISYTLTAAVNGITCETTKTECWMFGISAKIKIAIMASDQTGSYPIVGHAIQNSGAIEMCGENRKYCHVGAESVSIPTYGNEGTNAVKDCTFAAVANWEHVVLGLNPDPEEINAEFETSGGVDTGLTNDQVFYYWSEVGIGGLHLKEATPVYLDPESLKSIISDPRYQAVIAQLYFSDGQNIGGFQLKGNYYHWVVVDGFTPTGPLVLTWGMDLQMTWQQWNTEVVAAWRITVRN